MPMHTHTFLHNYKYPNEKVHRQNARLAERETLDIFQHYWESSRRSENPHTLHDQFIAQRRSLYYHCYENQTQHQCRMDYSEAWEKLASEMRENMAPPIGRASSASEQLGAGLLEASESVSSAHCCRCVNSADGDFCYVLRPSGWRASCKKECAKHGKIKDYSVDQSFHDALKHTHTEEECFGDSSLTGGRQCGFENVFFDACIKDEIFNALATSATDPCIKDAFENKESPSRTAMQEATDQLGVAIQCLEQSQERSGQDQLNDPKGMVEPDEIQHSVEEDAQP